MRTIATAGSLVFLLAFPATLLVVAFVSFGSIPPELESEPIPIFLEATPIDVSNERLGRFVVSQGTATEVLMPGDTTGTVTELGLQPGQAIRSGDLIARFGSTPLVAVSTPSPFGRDLSSGARGEDVLMLQTFLSFLGFDIVEDGEFGAQTALAVREFRRTLGINDPSSTFFQSEVAWLPQEEIEVEEVLLTLGGVPPVRGTPLIRGSAPIESVEIQDSVGNLSLIHI